MHVKNLWLIVMMLVLVPVAAFAQEADPTPSAPWYTTSGGVAVATLFGVSLLKRIFGNVSGFNQIPTWIYAVLVSLGLTALTHYVLHTLVVETTVWEMFYNAAVSAAISSGIYEWLNNSTKTLASSAVSAGVRVDPDRR